MLHERITAALTGTTPGPWEWGPAGLMEAPSRIVGEVHTSTADASLIAAAPGLLAECARRLDPGDIDVPALVQQLRNVALCNEHVPGEEATNRATWVAADLLAQAFLPTTEENPASE